MVNVKELEGELMNCPLDATGRQSGEDLGIYNPPDVCRFTLVSKSVQSAAESDSAWGNFLPSDYQSIISASTLPSPIFFQRRISLFIRAVIPLIDGGRKVQGILRLHGVIYHIIGNGLHYQSPGFQRYSDQICYVV
ncbi:hypothetical protein HAX54_012881 [Datura stramonium]|uniref:Uncharacterized protein n=1 Tax=Datura stramonium TaxID=4076 RepID=A0ABS8RYE3_DATST|nr:hypothetical protein [Datura stramonium]